MVLSPKVVLNDKANSCVEFEADLFVLFSTGAGVKPGFQGTVYVASTMQNAVVKNVKGHKVSACMSQGGKGVLVYIPNEGQ